MGFRIASLWSRPEVNVLNGKARSIPILNPVDVYGRVFLFSWWGFMVAFWSWYAFPPLLTLTIKKDLHLSQNEIANSNIISLVATFLVRIVAGPSCDRFGPKNTFAACLLLGSIPTFLAGTVHNATGLMILRFFVGILGGSFVPCQVWTTQFFDKNVIGTANSLTAGWGNAGGGITYFVMPAIFNSLVDRQGLTPHVAWRVAFVVPGILIVATAVAMLILCPDTPTGKWSDRHLIIEGISVGDRSSKLDDKKYLDEENGRKSVLSPSTPISSTPISPTAIETARSELVKKPTFASTLPIIFNPQTFMIASSYFCSFGAELAINSILGAYYLHNFPYFTQSTSGNWAAMFGLLNVVFRPFGGITSDLIYRRLLSNTDPNSSANNKAVWSKKVLLTTLMLMTGLFQILIGLLNPTSKSTMMGLIAVMALFLESSNGATFSLVPHIHPSANGMVSGITGATGNLGGVVFAIIFRYLGMDYGKGIWIIGVVTVAVSGAVSWISPITRR